jgi:hypothetical protein
MKEEFIGLYAGLVVSQRTEKERLNNNNKKKKDK